MFVFSADGHVVEPFDLFEANIPASLQKRGLRVEKADGFILTMAAEKVLGRTPIHSQPRLGPDGEPFGRANRAGNSNVEARFADMALDGVDAELVFPSVGLMAFMIEDPETELATAQVYNDWVQGLMAAHDDCFVRSGILPVRDFDNTLTEMKRLAAMGFTAVMLPSRIEEESGLPSYTSEAWDPVFALAQDLGLVFVHHCGTGRRKVRSFKGAGGAVMNYTVQAMDAMETIMALVAGGLLDRFPGAKSVFVEGGCSWLAGLAERMDEVYETMSPFVSPRLSLKPSEIITRQVASSFQYDRACVMSRAVTGTAPLLWAADYPHHEGTFPRSKQVICSLFDGIDITEKEKADIVGGNAARLFRLNRPEFRVVA